MLTTLKKGMLISLGALSLTRDKAQKIADDLEKRGLLDRKHARKFVNDLVARGEEERDALPRLVRREIDASLRRAGLSTTRQVSALGKRVTALERQAKNARGESQKSK